MVKIFGLEFGNPKEPQIPDPIQIPSVVPPENDDGASTILAGGGTQGYSIDLDGTVRTEAELISRYREIALHPEVEAAVEDIVNQAIITDDVGKPPVTLDMSTLEIPDNVKEVINQEFQYILRLLNFNNKAYELFKSWYVDGRMNYHVIVNEDKPELGIIAARYIDSLNIRKVREVTKVPSDTGFMFTEVVNEYYLYSEQGFTRQSTPNQTISYASNGGQYVKISKDAIISVTSGLHDQASSMVLSYLHSAIKPLNQLRMLEDATIIYRLTRAPERKIFKLEVGNLTPSKAAQYVNEMMRKHKNKVVYDQVTGEVRDNRKFMTMVEDYWFPMRDGRGPEIDVLAGGENLGEMTDVEYFKRKLYEALKVPLSRLESGSPFSLGRPSEITRDELKFMKFVERQRLQFSSLLLKFLRTQLILKGVLNTDEWEEISVSMRCSFADDNYFEELKQSDIMRDRASTANSMDPYVGIYFSRMWIWRKVWRLKEEEIEQMQMELEEEALQQAKQQKKLDGIVGGPGQFNGMR